MLWRLAWRNLWRNRTRTLITGSAVALSLFLQLFAYGTAESTYEKLMLSAVRTAGGNVLVHGDGYWDRRTVDRVVPNATAVSRTVSGVPGVTSVMPRVLVTGLISSARGNVGAEIIGFDPAREQGFDDKARFLGEGAFLQSGPDAPLPPIVLGAKIVADLGIELGGKVVVTATDPTGEFVRMAFELGGIVDTGSQMLDATVAWTTLSALQDAMKLGDAVTQIGVQIEDDAERDAARRAIAAALDDAGLEVLTWSTAIPEMEQFVRVDRMWQEITGTFIFLVVAFGIANTFLMAVLERIRELGLLSALGLVPARVARLVVAESLLLAVVFISVGLGLGFAAHFATAAHGIDFSEMSGGGEFEVSGVIMDDMIIYSVIDPLRWALACLAVAVLVVASASYPAWRATRTEPAIAMRTYE